MRRPDRAEGAFLIAAGVFPAAVLLAKMAPASALAGAAGGMLILYCMARLGARLPEGWAWPRWYGALRLVWCALLGAYVLARARGLFPQAGGSYLIPAVLAGLAAYAASRGEGTAKRAGAAAWAFILALPAVIALFSAPEADLRALLAPARWREAALAAGVCLVPGMALRRGGRGAGGFAAGAVLLAALPAAVCYGTLGAAQTADDPFPLYRAAQTISVFGVMERFEVLLSGALAASAFFALAIIAETGLSGVKRAPDGWSAAGFSAAALALSVPAGLLPARIFAAGSGVCCGLVPLGILLVAAGKKVSEKE